MAVDRYPTAGSDHRAHLDSGDITFDELREEFLLGYGLNTARAYWGDLEDWRFWAQERDKDVLALTLADIKQYVALLRRRKYAESTIRRRQTALRMFYEANRPSE